MHRKQLYLDISVYLFLTISVGTCKNFTSKLIIQGLLRLYNKGISYDLTKPMFYVWHQHVKLLSILMFNNTFNIEHTSPTILN